MCNCFVCLYAFASYVCLEPVNARKGYQITRDWSCEWQWATIGVLFNQTWVLAIIPRLLLRSTCALNGHAIFPARCLRPKISRYPTLSSLDHHSILPWLIPADFILQITSVLLPTSPPHSLLTVSNILSLIPVLWLLIQILYFSPNNFSKMEIEWVYSLPQAS